MNAKTCLRWTHGVWLIHNVGPSTPPPQELLGELGAHLSSKKISVEKALRIVYQPQVGRVGLWAMAGNELGCGGGGECMDGPDKEERDRTCWCGPSTRSSCTATQGSPGPQGNGHVAADLDQNSPGRGWQGALVTGAGAIAGLGPGSLHARAGALLRVCAEGGAGVCAVPVRRGLARLGMTPTAVFVVHELNHVMHAAPAVQAVFRVRPVARCTASIPGGRGWRPGCVHGGRPHACWART